MTLYVLPEAVVRFIRDYIRDIDDLLLLEALANNAERWWDGAAVADELLVDQREAGRLLEHFAARNMLEIRVTDDVRYQFRPGTQPLDDAAQACLSAYREHPRAVWREVTGSSGRRNLRDFADAFRIRRGDR